MKTKTRISWLLTTLVLGTSISVAGCGTNHTSQAPSQNGNSGVTSTPTANTAYPLKVTDQAGHTITIPKAPKHIASITLGTDEILSDLVPKENIAMVTSWATDPTQSNIVEFAKGIPQIADANAEQIIAVHPDLALMASYTKPEVVNQVNQAGIPTYEFTQFNSIQDVERNIKIIGQLVGNPAKAQQMVDAVEKRLQQIHDAIKGKPSYTVLDYSSYGFAAGADTSVNDLIVHAGGTNVASTLKGWQKITDEQIVKWNPDVIVFPQSEKGFDSQLLNNKALQSVKAIRNHRIYAIPDADLSSLSQYMTKGVEDLAKVLYPDLKLGQ
jgi:iron complex transport system substrate-binding protein